MTELYATIFSGKACKIIFSGMLCEREVASIITFWQFWIYSTHKGLNYKARIQTEQQNEIEDYISIWYYSLLLDGCWRDGLVQNAKKLR